MMKLDFTNLKTRAKNLFSSIEDEKLKSMAYSCFINTIDTTIKVQDDGSVFVITGDIPAMWLRDSSAQVMQYVDFIDDNNVDKLIRGVLKKQFEFINLDSYANAFMENDKCISEWDGQVETNFLPKQVWERKFELDSLCYPLFLLTKYLEKSNNYQILDNNFYQAFDKIINTIKVEQSHEELSEYYFKFLTRPGQVINKPSQTVQNYDKALVWSGFRPSDDICTYHYHIPDNMLAVTVLDKLSVVFDKLKDEARKNICNEIKLQIKNGIEKYGIINLDGFGKVYASEVDCLGNYHLNDDANIPSLLSIPYLEYPYLDKTIYSNTRRYILSENNKFYFEGKVLKGIGSPHTKGANVWPLSLIMQGLTSDDDFEIQDCLKMLINSDNHTNYMHEGINVDDPSIFTRKWFAWANSLFSEFIIKKIIKNN